MEEVELWEPPMNEHQRRVYYDPSPYVLSHGGRASGKTLICIDKLIRHCYLHNDALALIANITLTGATTGGAWEKLTTEATEVSGRPSGNLRKWREGMGLEHSPEPYMDVSKNMFVDIRNRHGGISRVMLKSMPVGSHIKDRIKPFAVSFFLFDELSNTEDPSYFYAIIQQLGRRNTVAEKAQQYVATCNPAEAGKRHWVYQGFFVKPHKWENKKRVEWDKDYGVHFVPLSENKWLENKEGYIKRLMQKAAVDPTAYSRDVLGLWVEKVVGSSMFQHYYNKNRVVKGEFGKTRLIPIAGEPIIIGYDPGDKNNAVAFGQYLKVGRKKVWRWFDCINMINERINTEVMVKKILQKLKYWCELPLGAQKNTYLFPVYHISDNWALNVSREGSYLYMEYERISKRLIEEGDEYKDLTPIKMIGAPKGVGSVAARIRLAKDLLLSDRIMVSASCVPIYNMFQNLRMAKDKLGKEDELKPLKTVTGEIHMFDAVSYPKIFFEAVEDKDVAIEEESPQRVVGF